MTIELFDPVGEVEAITQKPQRILETLAGKRVGCIFNHPQLELLGNFRDRLHIAAAPGKVHRYNS